MARRGDRGTDLACIARDELVNSSTYQDQRILLWDDIVKPSEKIESTFEAVVKVNFAIFRFLAKVISPSFRQSAAGYHRVPSDEESQSGRVVTLDAQPDLWSPSLARQGMPK